MTTENMSAVDAFDTIIKFVKRQENYVPRNYNTIGGMWTTDSYKLNDIAVQIADEGYTDIINHATVSAYRTFSTINPSINYSRGNEEDLVALAMTLKK